MRLIPLILLIISFPFPRTGSIIYLSVAVIIELYILFLNSIKNPLNNSKIINGSYDDEELSIFSKYYVFYRFPTTSSYLSMMFNIYIFTSIIIIPWLIIQNEYIQAGLILINIPIIYNFSVLLRPLHYANTKPNSKIGKKRNLIKSVYDKFVWDKESKNQNEDEDLQIDDLENKVNNGEIDQYEAIRMLRRHERSLKAEQNEFLIDDVHIDSDKNKSVIENWKKSNKSNIDNDKLQKLFFILDRSLHHDMIYWHYFVIDKIPTEHRYELISSHSDYSFKVPQIIAEGNTNKTLRFDPENIMFKVHNFENKIQVRYFNPYFLGLNFSLKVFYINNQQPLGKTLIRLLTIMSNKYGQEYFNLYRFTHNYLSNAIKHLREKNDQYYGLLTPTSKLFDLPVEGYFKHDLFDRSTRLFEEAEEIQHEMHSF